MPAMTGHLRKGQNRPAKTGRAARVRTGHHMSVARRHAVLDALVTRVNTGQITAASYLADTLGADEEFINSYASPYGKGAAKAYRETHGADPAKTALARRGHILVKVYAYSADDTAVLERAARTYKRTRDMLPVAPIATSAPVRIAPTLDPMGLEVDDLVSLYVSDRASEVAATIARIYLNVIGQTVADLDLGNGRTSVQNVEFLTPLRPRVPAHA